MLVKALFGEASNPCFEVWELAASMYFLQTDRGLQPSTDQGVDAFTYDTVDELNSNLFAVSDYYEAGADIHLCHDGFSGVR